MAITFQAETNSELEVLHFRLFVESGNMNQVRNGPVRDWWIDLMTTHPEVVEQLRQEIDSASATGSESPMDNITRLPHLNATLKEAMRLYPPSTALWILRSSRSRL